MSSNSKNIKRMCNSTSPSQSCIHWCRTKLEEALFSLLNDKWKLSKDSCTQVWNGSYFRWDERNPKAECFIQFCDWIRLWSVVWVFESQSIDAGQNFLWLTGKSYLRWEGAWNKCVLINFGIGSDCKVLFESEMIGLEKPKCTISKFAA